MNNRKEAIASLEQQIAEIKQDLSTKYPNADLHCNIIANETSDVADWMEILIDAWEMALEVIKDLEEELKTQHKDQEKLWEEAIAIGFVEHARLSQNEIAELKQEVECYKILWESAIEGANAQIIELKEENLKLTHELKVVTESGEWRDISSAPKDGSIIIVQGGIAYWRAQYEGWYSLTGLEYPGRPIRWEVTYWMPLPPPPSQLNNL